MSLVVDTDFGADTRAELLAEVRTYLPAFLGTAAVERADPAGDVTELLNLRRRDLMSVVAVHLALSDEVRGFLATLTEGLRSPLTSSIRPRVVSQAVRGGIDWGATVRHRAGAGAGATDYVIRPARRVFDTPENRALAYALDELEVALRRVVSGKTNPRSGVHNEGWHGETIASLAQVVNARRHHWLREVPAERPDALARKRLGAARTSFYRQRIPAVIELLDRYRDPSADDVTQLLAQRYFEPERDWRLFEFTIALRVARTFAARSSGKRKARLLVGGGRGPYARYVMPDGAEIKLWYQAWPGDSGPSVRNDVAARHRINAGTSIPDFVIQVLRDGDTADAVLLEAKATTNGGYLGSGLFQMLGYLTERPTMFAHAPAGWLVAPRSDAFEPASADDTDLWVVSSDDVAEALTTRFGY